MLTPRIIPLIAFSMLLGPTLALGLGNAQATTTEHIEGTFDLAGTDTYVLEVSSTTELTVSKRSSIIATATYAEEDRVQRVSAFVTAFRFFDQGSCPSGNSDPCFVGLFGRTIEDVASGAGSEDIQPTNASAMIDSILAAPGETGDLTVSTGPGFGVGATTGHDHGAFQSLTTGAVWSKGTTFGYKDFQGQATYRFIVSVPEAQSVSFDVDMHFSGGILSVEETTFDGGFVIWGEDMEPAGAHTPVSSTYAGGSFLCGQGCGYDSIQLPNLSGSNRAFAAMGSTWNGHYIVHNHLNDGFCVDCLGPLPTAFMGSYWMDAPSQLAGGPVVGATDGNPALSPVITLLGERQPGRLTFGIDAHAGLGAHDVLAVGTSGPLP